MWESRYNCIGISVQARLSLWPNTRLRTTISSGRRHCMHHWLDHCMHHGLDHSAKPNHTPDLLQEGLEEYELDVGVEYTMDETQGRKLGKWSAYRAFCLSTVSVCFRSWCTNQALWREYKRQSRRYTIWGGGHTHTHTYTYTHTLKRTHTHKHTGLNLNDYAFANDCTRTFLYCTEMSSNPQCHFQAFDLWHKSFIM